MNESATFLEGSLFIMSVYSDTKNPRCATIRRNSLAAYDGVDFFRSLLASGKWYAFLLVSVVLLASHESIDSSRR
jgi:hypothetical protein